MSEEIIQVGRVACALELRVHLVGIASKVALLYWRVATTDIVGARSNVGSGTVYIVGGAVFVNTANDSNVVTSCLLILGVDLASVAEDADVDSI